MDLKDMILVTENDRGTETNMLMALDDYKSFIAIDDMSEFAENLLQLGRTLGEADNFTEYYRAANVTVSARFCLDDIQLGHFLQGFYNDFKEFRFDKEASSSECVAKLKEIGMTDKGWVDDFNLHYEMENRSFERGQTFHNFNDHDYMVLEALSPRNLVVMDMKSGCPVIHISLLMLLFASWLCIFAKELLPTYYDTNKVNFVSQGIFRIHMAGLSFNNANWGYVLTVFRVFTLGTAILYPIICYISFLVGGISLWNTVKYPAIIILLIGMLVTTYIVGKKYE